MDSPNNLEDVIFKNRDEVSCDNIGCECYGDMTWCYKGHERRCGIYRDWEQKKFGSKNEERKP